MVRLDQLSAAVSAATGASPSYALVRGLAEQALRGGDVWRWDVNADWQMVRKGAHLCLGNVGPTHLCVMPPATPCLMNGIMHIRRRSDVGGGPQRWRERRRVQQRCARAAGGNCWRHRHRARLAMGCASVSASDVGLLLSRAALLAAPPDGAALPRASPFAAFRISRRTRRLCKRFNSHSRWRWQRLPARIPAACLRPRGRRRAPGRSRLGLTLAQPGWCVHAHCCAVLTHTAASIARLTAAAAANHALIPLASCQGIRRTRLWLQRQI